MSKLLDYLNLIDQDAAALANFDADAVKAMTAFGLSEEEQKALLSGDKQLIADLIGIAADDLPALHSPEATY